MLSRAFVGLLALLLGNAFIVGLNQIYDKEIDEINKPFLPIASGEMTGRFAWGMCGICAVIGPCLGEVVAIALLNVKLKLDSYLVPST